MKLRPGFCFRLSYFIVLSATGDVPPSHQCPWIRYRRGPNPGVSTCVGLISPFGRERTQWVPSRQTGEGADPVLPSGPSRKDPDRTSIPVPPRGRSVDGPRRGPEKGGRVPSSSLRRGSSSVRPCLRYGCHLLSDPPSFGTDSSSESGTTFRPQ